eukprot:gene34199-biopygen19791
MLGGAAQRQGVCSGKEAPAEKPTGRPPGAGRRDGWFPSEGCMGEGRPRHFCDNAQHASTAGSWSRGVDDAVPRASGHSAPQAPGQWATLSSQASSAKWGRQERGGKAPLGRGSSRPKRAPAPLPRDPEAGEQPCSFEGGPPHDVDSLRQDIGRSLDLKLKAGVSFVQVGDQGGQAGAAAAVDVFDEEPANEEGGTPE